jgi:hypothetical protein
MMLVQLASVFFIGRFLWRSGVRNPLVLLVAAATGGMLSPVLVHLGLCAVAPLVGLLWLPAAVVAVAAILIGFIRFRSQSKSFHREFPGTTTSTKTRLDEG